MLILLGLVMLGGLFIVPMVLRARAARGAREAFGNAQDPAEYGFAPADRLDIRMPGPDPELAQVLETARLNRDWRPAARLLALTGDDWERRWQRVAALAGAAAVELAQSPGQGGGWLRAWRVEAPKDAGGAMVQAEFLVQQAWRSQGPDGDAGFRIVLEEARAVCEKSALLAPGDPVPYITELAVARGLGYAQPEFEALWDKVTARAPHHMGAHLAALHYWCEKWHGSRELADRFAQGAARSAPEGSLLPALPLFAVFEHLPEVNLVRGLYASDVLVRAVEGALFAVDAAPAGHPVTPQVRHLLVWFLVRSERYADAMAQFREVDGFAGAVPWSYGPDPAAVYTAYRAMAVAGWEGRGGTPAALPPR